MCCLGMSPLGETAKKLHMKLSKKQIHQLTFFSFQKQKISLENVDKGSRK